jgi:NTP pyrophosphatase (non-canonical NTP hydrolase)
VTFGPPFKAYELTIGELKSCFGAPVANIAHDTILKNWLAHRETGEMTTNDQLADALEQCDWSGASIGNKELLRGAIERLRGKYKDPTIASPWVPTTNRMLLRRMGKTGEELGELMSVVCRIVIQGETLEEIDPGSGKTNRQRLIEETADVMAQLEANIERLDLPMVEIAARRHRKKSYMDEWEKQFEVAP